MLNAVSIVGLVGLTIIVTWGKIAARLRLLSPDFFGCALCVGFWIGLAGAIVRWEGLFEAVVTAGAVSVLSMLTKLVIVRLDT